MLNRSSCRPSLCEGVADFGADNPTKTGPVSRKAGKAAEKNVRVVSLFAGIGGFDHAFEMANGQVLLQCESNRFCQSVLRRHWPKAALVDDIRLLKGDQIPEADVWTAGFPCQDVSLARGNHGRSGFKGTHTSLFFRLMELIKIKQPPVVLLENVVGLLNSHKGRDFALVLHELTTLGYAVSWRVLNARYFGAPQSRSRVFLCAWKNDYKKALMALFESLESPTIKSERLGFTTKTVHKSGAIVPEISYCVAATSGRHTGNDWSRSYISYSDRVRRPTPTESERLQGFPAGWTVPENSYQAPTRGYDSERYQAIGNAVAVPVVRWIADRIAGLCRGDIHVGGPKKSFTLTVAHLAAELRTNVQTQSLKSVMAEVQGDNFAYKWRSGGCAWGDTIIEATAAPAPTQPVHTEFRNALDPEVPPDHYFLTPNAAAGILRRAESVGRNLFPPMRQALTKLVGQVATLPTPKPGEKNASTSVCAPRAVKCGKVPRDGREGARAL